MTNFAEYILIYTRELNHLFRTRYSPDETGHERGIPPFVLSVLATLSPSAVSIPVSHGGRGAIPAEILRVLEATSYESLPLSLMLGINGALFLEPVAKYGQPRLQKQIFKRFIDDKTLGGLMITEPGYGTDALSMRTSWEKNTDGYRITGEKHWAGLSGWADFWLMTARGKKDGGDLKRDVDFFVCDSSDPNQFVKPVEYYRNLGLYMLPYARNEVNVEVPDHHRLIPEKSGIRLMQDLLHRSRMRFPGMAAGFIRRMRDEAVTHTQNRSVSGKSLFSYDQVQKRLADLQVNYTVASAFCRHAADISSIDSTLSDKGLEANIHKTVMSDLMQESSQSLLQLSGAMGYRLNHIAGRSVVDSRPFQIFEGSNDVIYQQIADHFLSFMEKQKITHFFQGIKSHTLTTNIADRLKHLVDFSIQRDMIQRKKIELGLIFSRIAAMNWIQELGQRGYFPSLISQALEALTERIQCLTGGFMGQFTSSFMQTELQDSGAWNHE